LAVDHHTSLSSPLIGKGLASKAYGDHGADGITHNVSVSEEHCSFICSADLQLPWSHCSGVRSHVPHKGPTFDQPCRHSMRLGICTADCRHHEPVQNNGVSESFAGLEPKRIRACNLKCSLYLGSQMVQHIHGEEDALLAYLCISLCL
jgi:hypothetical protein